MTDAGNNWHIFPNRVTVHRPTYALGYRARPNGFDPDSCIFQVYAMDRLPEGTEPPLPPLPPNVRNDDLTNQAFWELILLQNFQNMAELQHGLKSHGLAGVRFNPVQEMALINFHKMLAEYMNDAA